ncbi:MAG: hypothetical protein E6G79_04995 [Alphaproteobacteria bacterium]|nr:MAG: hypothetical protein E6G79_04995 [Alphaproteobacteria bacterium]
MRQLHDFYVDVKFHIGCTIVERDRTIDPVDLNQQRQQFGLSPNDHLPRDVSQRLGEADELDRVAKPVITADQHQLVPEILASPNPLMMALPGVLDRPGSAIFAQASVA